MKPTLCLAILVAAVCLIDGKKSGEKELKIKSKYELRKIDMPSANPFHYGRKHMRGKMRGRHLQHLKNKHHGMKSVHDDWMKFPKPSKDCKLECPRGQFCVSSRRSGDEICVARKHFKEGRHMFRSFHRRKELLKGDMKGGDMKPIQVHGADMKKDLLVAEHMKDVYDLVSDYKKHANLDRPAEQHVEIKSWSADKQDLMLKEASNVQECRPRELEELKKRLTGYFDMLHTTSRIDRHRRKHGDHKKHGRSFKKDMTAHKLHKMHKRVKRFSSIEIEIHGHCKCSKSVMWDFRKMDVDQDGHLDHQELIMIARNRREPCIKPLMQSCDKNTDGHLNRGEWCCCLADIGTCYMAPCAQKKLLITKEDSVPRCDKEGYYEREQCHDKTGYCWCVDLNGNPIHDTKQHGGAHCGKYGPNGKPIDEQM